MNQCILTKLLCAIAICLSFMGCHLHRDKLNDDGTKSPDIVNIEDGFFTGKTTTSKGEVLYLGFEKLDASSLRFWEKYWTQSEKIAKVLELVPRFTYKPKLKSQLWKLEFNNQSQIAKILGFDKAKYDELLKYIQDSTDQKDYDGVFGSQTVIFGDLLAGLTGLAWIGLKNEKYDKFLIYGSNKPIIKRTSIADFDEDKTFFENFGHIVISMGGYDYLDTPITTHYGITKNISYFFSKNDLFKNVSLSLHGFAAAVWLSYFADKKYMTTVPIGKMGEILEKALPKDSVVLGKYPSEIQKLVTEGRFSSVALGTGTLTTITLDALSKLYIPAN